MRPRPTCSPLSRSSTSASSRAKTSTALLTSRPNALVIATALAPLAPLAVATLQQVVKTTTTIVVALVIMMLTTAAALLLEMHTRMAGTMSATAAMVVLPAEDPHHDARMTDTVHPVAATMTRMELPEGMNAATK